MCDSTFRQRSALNLDQFRPKGHVLSLKEASSQASTFLLFYIEIILPCKGLEKTTTTKHYQVATKKKR
jgi:hypothetical protein